MSAPAKDEPGTAPVFASARNARAELAGGIRDLVEGARAWPQWFSLGNHELADRYRRTVLGPLWMTFTMAAMVVAIGLLYSRIFTVDLKYFLPWLTAGFLCWNFISGTLQESSTTFIYNEGVLRQMRVARSVYIYRVLWRNAVAFLHNALVLAAVMLWFATPFRWTVILVLPGAVLLVANMLWMSLLIAMLGTRFRDVPPMIASILQLFFFLTPIVWIPRSADVIAFLQWNPFYHAVQLVRGPILGQIPGPLSWGIMIVIATFGWMLTIALFGRFRWRISYWL